MINQKLIVMKKLTNYVVLFTVMVIGATACSKVDDLPEETTVVAEEVRNDVAKNASAINKLLADVRKATKQYHDVDAALAAGYVNTEECVEGPPGAGAMGVHFVNLGLLDGEFDPLLPEVLLYEIKNNGEYKLTGVEYLYVGDESPMFAGEVMFHPFPQPFADYALHAWVWKGNPNGIFEDFNVNVSCP